MGGRGWIPSPFSRAVPCLRSERSSRGQVRYLVQKSFGASPSQILSSCDGPGRKMVEEKLWRAFFSDPSQWWDNRAEKQNSRYPDFNHKKTRQSLWLGSRLTPCWVEAELATIAPGILQTNTFSWNVRLRRHVKAGDHEKTMQLFQQMEREGMIPDKFTFVPILKACSGLKSLEKGRRVHEKILERGYECDLYVATGLVDMYAKCGSIEDAWSVFNKMPEQSVVSWSAMIAGFAKSGQGLKGMELFRRMQQEGVEPDAVTFVGALTACASAAALEEGRRVHEQIIERRCESDVYIANCLVDMYAKCGSMEDAWGVFKKMRKHDVISWNAMIAGHVKCGRELKAMVLLKEMQQEGVEPNAVTFIGLLNASASIAALEEGRHIHEEITRRSFESDVYVATCLVDMYAKCGSIEDAWSVFNKIQEHNVVSWTAMIVGYVKSGYGLKAVDLFRKMQQEGVEPDEVTFVGALNACASIAALEEGRLVHEKIIQRGYESDVHVASSLVDMYAKCGSMENAWSVFNRMPGHDVVAWNAVIAGCVKSGQGQQVMVLFTAMREEEVEPDAVTFSILLNACASIAALEEGRRVHEEIIRRGSDSNVYVTTCLVDMYAKCGSVEDAWIVFNKMQEPNVVTWTTMIGSYAKHGYANEAIGLFKRMGKEGVEINGITFTCLLSACSHGGLVKEGLRYFKSISSCYNLCPTTEHYAGMVDLLGRAGWLQEAEEIVKKMPVEKGVSVWRSLLGACRIHGNIEIAERSAQHCWELDPENASGHVLLSNTYAAAREWGKSAAIAEERLERKM